VRLGTAEGRLIGGKRLIAVKVGDGPAGHGGDHAAAHAAIEIHEEVASRIEEAIAGR
jgi:hypothetical protein